MATLSATETWQSAGLLSVDTIFQCTDGCAQTKGSASQPAADALGTELHLWDTVIYRAGQTVWYKVGRSKAVRKGRIETDAAGV